MQVNYQPRGLKNEGTFVPDNLIAGAFPSQTKSVTIKSGQNLVRGTILEEGTAGNVGKFSAVTTAANARYVLLEDCDATAADVVGVPVAITGTFNKNAVTLGSGPTLAAVAAALEPLSIFLVDAVA